MRYKESAIAVMVAVMLGTASLLGGLTVPALASHDPDAVQVKNKTITQGDDESKIVDTIGLTAKKSTLRASGTVTIELVQDGNVLRTAKLGTSSLTTTFKTIEIDVPNINVTGSFEVLVEYLGSGIVSVSDIAVNEGTEVAGNPDDNEEPQNNDPNQSQEQEDLENVIASKAVAPDSDDSMTVDTVEFAAKKSTLRASGTLTIAIVQDDKILDKDTMSTSALGTTYKDLESEFDLEVQGDFQVVFMFEGSGIVTVTDINVPGTTAPAGNPGSGDQDDQDGTIELTVKSANQDNQAISGLWVTVTNGMATQGDWTQTTFELGAGTYTLSIDDFYDDAGDDDPSTGTTYTFVQWSDGNTAKSRAISLSADKTITAKFNVVGNSPPPPPPEDPPGGDPPGDSPPPSSGPGSITAYAYRIPSSHWGPTFVSANAQMYFVLYNSTGYMVYGGFFDENGNTVTGLNDGEQYWIMPTDCHHCHGGTHDVAFHHWENGDTERVRGVMTGASVGAYYEFVPDTP
jgi:hypothetical protein